MLIAGSEADIGWGIVAGAGFAVYGGGASGSI